MAVHLDLVGVADVLLHETQRREVVAARADEHLAPLGGVHETMRHQRAGRLEGCYGHDDGFLFEMVEEPLGTAGLVAARAFARLAGRGNSEYSKN